MISSDGVSARVDATGTVLNQSIHLSHVTPIFI